MHLLRLKSKDSFIPPGCILQDHVTPAATWPVPACTWRPLCPGSPAQHVGLCSALRVSLAPGASGSPILTDLAGPAGARPPEQHSLSRCGNQHRGITEELQGTASPRRKAVWQRNPSQGQSLKWTVWPWTPAPLGHFLWLRRSHQGLCGEGVCKEHTPGKHSQKGADSITLRPQAAGNLLWNVISLDPHPGTTLLRKFKITRLYKSQKANF